MPACLRLSAVALVVLSLAGCGGGSGNGGSGGGGGGEPTTVTFTFKGATPTAVAAKIGSGAFTAQSFSSGRLSLSIPAASSGFAVAYVCPPIDPNSTNVQLATTEENVIEANIADGTNFTLPPCPYFVDAGSQSGTLTGSVDARALSGSPTIQIGAETSDSYAEHSAPNDGGSFSIGAPLGNDRVQVLAYESSLLDGYIGVFSLVAARNFSSQAVPGELNGGSTVVLGAADAVIPKPLTYHNVSAGYSDPLTMVFADIGAGDILISTGATSEYPALPAAATQNGDFYDFVASSHNSSMTGQIVQVETTATGADPVAITLPAPWTYAGPTPAALPTFNCDYIGFSGKPGVTQTASLGWLTGATSETLIEVYATAKFQNGSTTLAIPDLSGLTGFVAPPPSGKTVGWSAGMSQASAGAFQPMPLNAVTSAVQQGGAYTVP